MVHTPPPSPPATPKGFTDEDTKPKVTKQAPASVKPEGSPASRKMGGKLTPEIKRGILALKISGMTTKDISIAVGQNYKTVWNHVDKAMKAKEKFGKTLDGSDLAEMSDAEKKDAALALKLAGWKTKDIALQLDMKYKTLWNFFDQQQKLGATASGSGN